MLEEKLNHTEPQALAADEAEAHELFERCEHLLAGRCDVAFLQAAQNDRERRFFIDVNNFFLREKQAELTAAGVF